jgi:hypothetical protein
METNTKPYVAAACVCESVLTEKDGVASLIRIVDTFHLEQPQSEAPSVPISMRLKVFVSVKAGALTGEHEIGLKFHSPDGKSRAPHRWPVVFDDRPESGANLIVDFLLSGPAPGELPKPGLYWFDVLWTDEVLTRIPFRITRKPQAPAAPSMR